MNKSGQQTELRLFLTVWSAKRLDKNNSWAIHFSVAFQNIRSSNKLLFEHHRQCHTGRNLQRLNFFVSFFSFFLLPISESGPQNGKRPKGKNANDNLPMSKNPKIKSL